MKNFLFASLLTALALLTPTVKAIGETELSDCRQAVTDFLSHPTNRTFTVLVSEKEGQCWTAIESSNANLQLLNNLVAKGNRWSALYLTTKLKNLDGGNLEDSLIALGKFSDRNMEGFLEFAHSGKISTHEFTDALTMLPLSLNEDTPALLNILEARKKKLMDLHRKDLANQKKLALSAIDKFIYQIKTTTTTSSKIQSP